MLGIHLDLGFIGRRLNCFWNDRKKLSQFGHNVRKCKLLNTVTASINTIMGQNDRNVSVKKASLISMTTCDPCH